MTSSSPLTDKRPAGGTVAAPVVAEMPSAAVAWVLRAWLILGDDGLRCLHLLHEKTKTRSVAHIYRIRIFKCCKRPQKQQFEDTS